MRSDMKCSGVDWIGDIPNDWEVKRVKNAFIRKKDEAHQDNPIVLSLARAGVRVRDLSNNEGQIAESYFNYNPVEPGDLLLNPMDLYSGANCSISKVNGVISPAYINLKALQGYNPLYYDFYFKTLYWSMVMFAHGKGVSFDNRWTISAEDLFKLSIPVPPLEEQNSIAKYLERECTRIDAVIQHTQESIEEYKKIQQSLITEVVTHGLHKNKTTKDSGVEWIGRIPEDWDIIKIGKIFRLRNEKNDLPADQVQLLSLYTGIGVFPQGEHYTASGNHAQTVDGYKIVKKNDIVVNIILAWMGAIGVSDYDGVTSPAYDVYIPNTTKVNPHYYHYVLRTNGIAGECYKYGRGIMMMRWRTYATEFKQIYVPFPSLEEQTEIADYLDQKCSEVNSLIRKKELFVDELENYKKSLIYEYVTGKRDVVK